MVALASIDPVDGTAPIEQGYPVTVELTDSSDLDLSLIEIVVNGVSFTQANGGLVFYGITRVSSGSIVYDYTDVFSRTVGRWSASAWETISIIVKYDGAAVSTTSAGIMPWSQTQGFGAAWGAYPIAPDQPAGSAGVSWMGYAAQPEPPGAPLIAAWARRGTVPLLGDPILSFGVRQLPGWSTDAYYWVAHWVRFEADASGVVGTPTAVRRVDSSVVIYGPVTGRSLSSMIVQGPVRALTPASAIVGVRFRTQTGASAVVGVPFLRRIPASAVVYAVQRGPLLEVLVADQTTIDALTEAGITFGGA